MVGKRLAAVTVILLVSLAATARADLPSVRFDRLAPLGAAAGSEVEVEVAGADMEDVKSLLFDHPGLRAAWVKDHRFKVAVAADVPAGTYDVRLVGRFGVSNPRLFAVAHGLAEVTKKGPNHEPAAAQAVAVNSVVNGVTDGNREDFYRFAARKGQRVVLECQAQKLDSPLDANLTLTAADGRPLAANGDYHGRDPLIDFVAPQDGEYLVSLHDLSFRGGHPYRLILTDRPRVENVFPRAVQAGHDAEITALGRNLGPQARPSPWRVGELALDEFRWRVTPPAEVTQLGAYRFQEHPTDHSVLPTAATCTLTGFQARPPLEGGTADPAALLIVDTPVTLEIEPNDTPEQAQPLTLPAVVSGRFDRPRDADWYTFEAPQDGPYVFEVFSERIAGQADPYLVVVDDKGNRLAELDDYGHRINAFDGHLRDPYGTVNLAAKRKYRVLVKDRYDRGGARYQYVLAVRQPVPDFYVAVMHHQNPGPGGTLVRRGGAAYLDVIVHQRDGFNGPITLTAEGLPPGLHAAPTAINNTNHGTFVLWADADAAEWTGTVKLFATGSRGDVELRREVRPYTRVWNSADQSSSRPTRELAVAIRETDPFALRFAAERVEVEAGKKAEVKLALSRLWPDFKNAVTVLPLAFPGNVKMANAEFKPGAAEVTVTLEMQAGTRPGAYTLTVLGQAQVPYAKEAGAAQKPNTLVALPARPITVTVVAGKK